MGIIIGSARIDENGKLIGGTAGDQKQTSSTNDTKGEISMQDFYVHSKGWYVLRPKKAIYANAIAERMKTLCNNKNIGYDQGNRDGVIDNGIESKVKTEADCSSSIRACVKEATGVDPGNFNTSNEVTALSATGLFKDKIAYTSSTKIYTGDILVTKTKGHTVACVEGNARKIDVPFNVKVEITNLVIRTGAGTNYAKTGSYVQVGKRIITEVKTGKGSVLGWGKLKSGAGWINLDKVDIL